ncbi:MAG TPA: heat-inducible transcriptional repressor HrcA, partial [Gammaproteobacteria bacterium]|nr:heat-inducible transcriptional repressor HrcA [Gammaproteobacteria bacterium]
MVIPSAIETVEENISDRAKSLLKHLVELYIQSGQPVGSKTLADSAKISLSPATIRKVMNDLEHYGFVQSPHTSAGRVPTARGFRFFVDSLLTVHPLDQKQVRQFQNQLNPNQTTNSLITTASSLLSEITQMIGIVTLPKQEKLILKYLEFIPLADNRTLVVLVVNEKEVQNRIIVTEKPYSASELSQASNFLMQHFVGKDLSEARAELLQAIKREQLIANHLMETILEVSTKAFEKPKREEYVIAGEFNLLAQCDPPAMDH